MWALIGGSGFEKFDAFEKIEELNVETPYGPHSSSLARVKWKGEEILFLSRHGKNHELLPSEINYRANIFALSTLGAKGVLSFSAVGSLKEEMAPEDLVFIDQYIDFTKKREGSFCGSGSVGHYSFADPVETALVHKVKEILKDLPLTKHFGGTYICVEGPRFSSRAESKMFQKWGADIIGMTNMPECYLALEAGLTYLPFCFVTDYDCWKEDEEHVTIEIVKSRMDKNYKSSQVILDKLVPTKLYNDFPRDNINSAVFAGEQVSWLNKA